MGVLYLSMALSLVREKRKICLKYALKLIVLHGDSIFTDYLIQYVPIDYSIAYDTKTSINVWYIIMYQNLKNDTIFIKFYCLRQ